MFYINYKIWYLFLNLVDMLLFQSKTSFLFFFKSILQYYCNQNRIIFLINSLEYFSIVNYVEFRLIKFKYVNSSFETY